MVMRNSLQFTRFHGWKHHTTLSNVPTRPSDLSCALQEQQQSSVYFALCSWLVQDICLKGRDYNFYDRESSHSVGACWQSKSVSTAYVMSVMQLTEKISPTLNRGTPKQCATCARHADADAAFEDGCYTFNETQMKQAPRASLSQEKYTFIDLAWFDIALSITLFNHFHHH